MNVSSLQEIPQWVKLEAVSDCASVEEFAHKYRKADRFTQRGEEYVAAILASHREDLQANGYTVISKHDNITGNIIAYCPSVKTNN